MDINKLINLIELHYRHHGIVVRLKLLKVIGNYERMIFRYIINPGTKVNLIFERAHDIQTALQIPLFEPFWNGLAVCLAVSKYPFKQNSLIKMLSSPAFKRSKMLLPLALGYDMQCEMFFMDLAASPHILYGGATNSGKSIGLKCLILSLLTRNPVSKVNLILIDIGTDTMELFEGVPHLSCPIIKDVGAGIHAINALIMEMEHRKSLTDDELRKLPALICIIDEYISFISDTEEDGTSKDLGAAISLLLQRGRHAKIHLVLAAQNPKNGFMKADISNITTRMAFRCDNYHVSATILGKKGAESLPGKGAMLFKSTGYPNPIQIQGAFIPDNDIMHIVSQIKMLTFDTENKFQITNVEGQSQNPQISDDVNSSHTSAKLKEEKMFADIVIWSLKRDTISAEQIQKHFHIGKKAYAIVDKLCEMGLASEKFANQPRKVLSHSVDDMSQEIMGLLARHSYTPAQIEEIFSDKEEC